MPSRDSGSTSSRRHRRILAEATAALFACVPIAVVPAIAADAVDTVARVKHAIVAVGTFDPIRAPQFSFRGTGFATGDGSLIVTNAHVLPDAGQGRETLGIAVPAEGERGVRFREAKRLAIEETTDLVVLRIEGEPLPALRIGDSDTVREGQSILLTGFPIGSVLGLFPATHRGLVAAITPIAIPQARSADLTSNVVKMLAAGGMRVLQLDVTAYPGNSGSPIYDPQTGDVLGVVNMVMVKDVKESGLGRATGITYAIPAKHVRYLLDKVR